MLDSGLRNIIADMHSGEQPETYDRGSECIDLLAISAHEQESIIKKCGYFPSYLGNPSDHRAYYVDIDTKTLFAKTQIDTTKHIYKRFNTNNVIKCKKYITNLEKGIYQAKIGKKIDALEKDMIKYLNEGTGCIKGLIMKCKTLFNKTSELMIGSEKKLGKKHYVNGFPFSPKLKEAATNVINVRKEIRCQSILPVRNEEMLTITKEQLKEAYTNLKRVQKQSQDLRDTHLESLAEIRAEQWKVKKRMQPSS